MRETTFLVKNYFFLNLVPLRCSLEEQLPNAQSVFKVVISKYRTILIL